MIDISTARALVEKELSLNQPPTAQWTIVDIVPVEDLGWIFSYSASVRHPDETLAHIIVDQKNGTLSYAGKSKPKPTPFLAGRW